MLKLSIIFKNIKSLLKSIRKTDIATEEPVVENKPTQDVTYEENNMSLNITKEQLLQIKNCNKNIKTKPNGMCECPYNQFIYFPPDQKWNGKPTNQWYSFKLACDKCKKYYSNISIDE